MGIPINSYKPHFLIFKWTDFTVVSISWTYCEIRWDNGGKAPNKREAKSLSDFVCVLRLTSRSQIFSLHSCKCPKHSAFFYKMYFLPFFLPFFSFSPSFPFSSFFPSFQIWSQENSMLEYITAVGPRVNHLTLLSLSFTNYKMRITSHTFIRELWWSSNEIIYVKSLINLEVLCKCQLLFVIIRLSSISTGSLS